MFIAKRIAHYVMRSMTYERSTLDSEPRSRTPKQPEHERSTGIETLVPGCSSHR